MKKLFTLFFVMVTMYAAYGQITVTNSIVPTYIQGVNGTNNNRTPFYFWVELGGLTPGATYRYYTTMDSLLAAGTSNGAGNPMVINMPNQTFRRVTSASLSNPAGHDSIIADAAGTWKGWMGVEPTANARFTVGNILYPKIIMNNGAGGTTVVNRVLVNQPVTVINYGTTSGSATQGSFLYDSTTVAPKNFAGLYTNTTASGRPVSFAVIEMEGIIQHSVTSILAAYRTLVDSIPQRWGTIVPNNLATGIQRLQYYNFSDATWLDSIMDTDGQWCWANTVNMNTGTTATYLRSLEGIPAPVITTVPGSYCELDSITLAATGLGTITWFTQGTGGSSVATGSSFVGIAEPGYWAEAEQNGCVSLRDSVMFTITPATLYFADTDNDTYGDSSNTLLACSPVAGYVSIGGDCDDNNNAVNPGATEVCDGIDNDCDNLIDEGCVYEPEMGNGLPFWLVETFPFSYNSINDYYLSSYMFYVADTIGTYITNTGNDTLFISSVTITNQSSTVGTFSVHFFPAMIPAGDSAAIEVIYDVFFIYPNGFDTAVVRINNNDADESLYDITYAIYSFAESVENNSLQGMSLYPTLVENSVTLSSLQTDMKDVLVMITDISGRIVREIPVHITSGKYVVDGLDALTPGVYFITINHGGKVFTQKIVKK